MNSNYMINPHWRSFILQWKNTVIIIHCHLQTFRLKHKRFFGCVFRARHPRARYPCTLLHEDSWLPVATLTPAGSHRLLLKVYSLLIGSDCRLTWPPLTLGSGYKATRRKYSRFDGTICQPGARTAGGKRCAHLCTHPQICFAFRSVCVYRFETGGLKLHLPAILSAQLLPFLG